VSSALEGLQDWYLQQCNGDWEHRFQIRIYTLDNPGWGLRIALEETALSDVAFTPVRVDRSEADWVHSDVVDREFAGHCGPQNLSELIQIFVEWSRSIREEDEGSS